MDSYAKKRKSNYSGNRSNQRSKPARSLLQGMSGFLCTCNFREKDCIRESYNLLNEYADRIYGDNNQAVAVAATTVSNAAASGQGKDDDDDIQSSLSKEIASLKADGKKSRFQVLESGAKNCIFIKTTLKDPVELVHRIVQDLEQQKKQKTRFLLRLLPIEITCNAYMDDIAVYATPLIEKYFTAEGKTFSILFNCRNNSSISRDKVIDLLAQLVQDQNAANRVDLKQPQLSVLVEIIRGMCCISVLPEYFRYRRYNLLEITGSDQVQPSMSNAEGEKEESDLAISEGKIVDPDVAEAMSSTPDKDDSDEFSATKDVEEG